MDVCVFVPIENSSCMEVMEQHLALSLSQQPKSAALSGFSLTDFLPPGENSMYWMFLK